MREGEVAVPYRVEEYLRTTRLGLYIERRQLKLWGVNIGGD